MKRKKKKQHSGKINRDIEKLNPLIHLCGASHNVISESRFTIMTTVIELILIALHRVRFHERFQEIHKRVARDLFFSAEYSSRIDNGMRLARRSNERRVFTFEMFPDCDRFFPGLQIMFAGF